MSPEHFSPPPSTEKHSYEAFSQREFYRRIDRQTVSLAPESSNVLDIATGTGAMIELLIEQNKLRQGGFVFGVDIDATAVEAATEKFSNPNYHQYDFKFLQGRSEEIPAENDSFELAIFGNAIHLTDVPASLTEVSRVLKPGGTLLVSSAYVKDVAYAEGGKERWGRLAVGAIKKARTAGLEVGSPDDLLHYSQEEYRNIALQAGFSKVETYTELAQMNREDVLAICNYDGFATGSLPNVAPEIGRSLLTQSAEELFNKYGTDATFPRGWMLMRATK